MTIQTLIQAVEKADSANALLDAVSALAEANSIEAIPTLITVLGYNNPGAAVAAVDGLIQLGEPAVIPLLEQLDGYNYGARAWAVRALSGIGDPRGLEVLLESAGSDFALSVRRAAARGLGNIHWDQLPPEQLPDAQFQTLMILQKTLEDPEWIVRYGGVFGLQGLAIATQKTQPEWFSKIKEQLQQLSKTDKTLAVRARAKWAIQKLE
ncbi:Phycocyanin alpha-subunit phycocyanobilin lyase [Planktothrix serta PCC 8927]|uniref:Phycocyanin alpha-subunit phycocyanobilin lyase n=1 Tax=Planktothrix serta PCC 8927 TaxID=671068 RepID=A0A7Z9BWY3_9CYAN|nr:HEAT repeat domain-containing protein [Planktothrix serta]VXD20456.1 Phycocyanin alpha-subunit phycocyanobilin lyase [Planktothrix serta PCC 8927]